MITLDEKLANMIHNLRLIDCVALVEDQGYHAGLAIQNTIARLNEFITSEELRTRQGSLAIPVEEMQEV